MSKKRRRKSKYEMYPKIRVSQLLDLTIPAPAIQEELLFLEAIDGKEPVSERGLREVVGTAEWAAQKTTFV